MSADTLSSFRFWIRTQKIVCSSLAHPSANWAAVSKGYSVSTLYTGLSTLGYTCGIVMSFIIHQVICQSVK